MRTKTQKTYATRRAALQAAATILGEYLHTIPGLRSSAENTVADIWEQVTAGRDHLAIEWDRAWGANCSLSISLHHASLEQEETRIVHHVRASVELSWSSTGRSPAEAVAAIALYRQVAELACLLESVLARMDVAEVAERPAQTPAAK
jgi:hypothetical protein